MTLFAVLMIDQKGYHILKIFDGLALARTYLKLCSTDNKYIIVRWDVVEMK